MTGEQLKQEIRKRGFTIRAIAQHLGKNEQSFGRVLRQTNDISTEYVEGAAECMGVSPAELYSPISDTIKVHHDGTAVEGTYSCDPRLLDIIKAKDRQLEKSQQLIDRLVSIIEDRLPAPSENSDRTRTK